LTSGGAHLLLDIDPDIAVFAKAISNGYPMAAVIGKGAVMEAVQASFISSTYWTERIGPAAALATIRKHRAYAVHQHLDRIGRRVQTGWLEIADRAGLPLEVGGLFPLSHFSFKTDNPAAARTLFTQEMLKKGFLATAAVYATFAHSEKHVDDYLNAAEASFRIIREASEDNKIEQLLEGPVAHSGFQRLT
jgi:glutamate-1-semialdehyde 2,1-aminomutase